MLAFDSENINKFITKIKQSSSLMYLMKTQYFMDLSAGIAGEVGDKTFNIVGDGIRKGSKQYNQ